MERYGPICYALVCIDPLTEFSRGTAFVKFKVNFYEVYSILFITEFTFS